MEIATQSPVKFTDGAVSEIKRLIITPGFDASKSLRVGVKGGGCSGLSYVLEFDNRKDSDVDYEFDDIRFVMDRSHEMYLFGMQVDWQGGLNSRGFTFSNPNASATCGCGTSFAV